MWNSPIRKAIDLLALRLRDAGITEKIKQDSFWLMAKNERVQMRQLGRNKQHSIHYQHLFWALPFLAVCFLAATVAFSHERKCISL